MPTAKPGFALQWDLGTVLGVHGLISSVTKAIHKPRRGVVMQNDVVTTSTSSDTASFIKHAHLPRSIWAARLVWGIWYRGNCNITVDIILCAGCCRGPLARKTSTSDWNGVEAPGPMEKASPSGPTYPLYMDGIKVQLLRFADIDGIKLGDYGHYDATFKRDGNIFQDLAADPSHGQIKRKVSTGNGRTNVEDVMTVWASGDSSSRLMLRQPTGLSLLNNQQLVLSLKALSRRLTGKCLVTSVVCSTSRRGLTWTELCYLSTPQVWCRDPIDEERRTQFWEIREQFYALLNWSRPATSAGNRRSPKSKTTTKEAIKYFSAMFGIVYFEAYVGKVTFFDELSTGREPCPGSETLVGGRDLSINPLVKTLRRKMDKVREIPGQRVPGAKQEISAISKTLGIKLLEEMATIYSRVYHELCLLKGDLDRSCKEYNMFRSITEFISSPSSQTSESSHVGIHDMVEDIKQLQMKLDDTKNIDEQLALEEDITGKVLWACHSGLRSAVGHIPAMVLHSALENDKVYNLMDRVRFLEEITRVLNDALAELPTDDQSHLRRIMADAEAGTSKYQLLQEEGVREQSATGAMHRGQTTA
ncbi:hypothetical protein EDD16DRAFT_96657 [Pisolithus croceorrhizus]|nr:hypothetical protein EDD16DRAFT_96657 [Pisolithus croceorrhizus]